MSVVASTLNALRIKCALFEISIVGSFNSHCLKCLHVGGHSQCVLIRVLAKQKLVAFETQVYSLMLALAASFSENGDETWLETEALGYGHSS